MKTAGFFFVVSPAAAATDTNQESFVLVLAPAVRNQGLGRECRQDDGQQRFFSLSPFTLVMPDPDVATVWYSISPPIHMKYL